MKRKSELESAGEIMQKLGLSPSATQTAKAAFLRNLIRSAYGVEVKIPDQLLEKNFAQSGEQLSFDFDAETKAG